MKLDDAQFRKGQAEFVQGTGIRTMVQETCVLLDAHKDDEAFSLVWGYVDGIVGAIRATHNLLSTGEKPK